MKAIMRRKRLLQGFVVVIWLMSGAAGWAHEEHDHGATASQPSGATAEAAGDRTLTGEVVDVFCYLSHGKDGLGKAHAGCAKKCIQGGLPVAIKVGDQLYLASMADHTAANKPLAEFAGQQVTVRGQVMERDGQHLIAIEHVEQQPTATSAPALEAAPASAAPKEPDDYGSSTLGPCVSDSDCMLSGCNTEICQSKSEKPIASACIATTQPTPRQAGYACRCQQQRCQWTKLR